MQAVKRNASCELNNTGERHGHWRDAGKRVTRPIHSRVSSAGVSSERHVVEKLKGISKICFAIHSEMRFSWERKEYPRSSPQSAQKCVLVRNRWVNMVCSQSVQKCVPMGSKGNSTICFSHSSCQHPVVKPQTCCEGQKCVRLGPFNWPWAHRKSRNRKHWNTRRNKKPLRRRNAPSQCPWYGCSPEEAKAKRKSALA